MQNMAERLLNAPVRAFVPAAGGCINHGGEIKTAGGASYFIKWNNAQLFPDMFAAEHNGLLLLAKANAVRVPAVMGVVQDDRWQVMVMEYIRPSKPAGNYWEMLGEQLAALHLITAPRFGLDTDNYIGSLPQHNTQKAKWVDFFISNRLEFQLLLAEQHGRAEATLRKRFEKLYTRLPEIFPDEPPALLHGDLWSGNLITGEAGQPCLIDPAVYFGHREAELAFTRLFGGFDSRFYQAYQSVFALHPGFSDRADVYNLYPLLVHVNLFGGSYLASVLRTLSRLGC